MTDPVPAPCHYCANGVALYTVYTEDGLSTRNVMTWCRYCGGQG